jgi:inner membrane protein
VVVLGLVLMAPIIMIAVLISERHERRDAAVAEVSGKWGNAQTLTGPALVLPYAIRRIETTDKGPGAHVDSRKAIFLPRRLSVSGRIQSESRSRGIFSVAVYQSDLTFDGEFERPNLADLGIDASSVDWARAHIAVGITDVRAVRDEPTLTWDGKTVRFQPGTNGFMEAASGIHALVAAEPDRPAYKFSFALPLNGSVGLYVAPFAEDTVVQLTSNSPFPNFQGNWLPAERTVKADGFDARWRVSYLGRNYPQSWISGPDLRSVIAASRFGVEMNEPVDHYRMADRSVKYAGLFILLTFAFAWLIEILSGVRVHPIQYLMLGGALCVFYLLELSLSEHLQFPLAYALASVAVIAMLTAYSRVIFRRGTRAVLIGSGVAALYGYLFVLLTNEDAALLAGSIGLFVILAAIMFVTRKVDWYGGQASYDVGRYAGSEPR